MPCHLRPHSYGLAVSANDEASGSFPPIADMSRLPDAAPMSARAKPFTIAFYVAFALWFTATSYSSPGFYGWLLAPIVGNILGFSLIALFLVVVVLAGRRAVREASFPWLDLAVVGCAIIGFDLFWRFYLSPLAWDAFKLTSIAVDVATPLIAALGLAAVVYELRRPAQIVAG